MKLTKLRGYSNSFEHPNQISWLLNAFELPKFFRGLHHWISKPDQYQRRQMSTVRPAAVYIHFNTSHEPTLIQ